MVPLGLKVDCGTAPAALRAESKGSRPMRSEGHERETAERDRRPGRATDAEWRARPCHGALRGLPRRAPAAWSGECSMLMVPGCSPGRVRVPPFPTTQFESGSVGPLLSGRLDGGVIDESDRSFGMSRPGITLPLWRSSRPRLPDGPAPPASATAVNSLAIEYEPEQSRRRPPSSPDRRRGPSRSGRGSRSSSSSNRSPGQGLVDTTRATTPGRRQPSLTGPEDLCLVEGARRR